jgi:hypothetical protein
MVLVVGGLLGCDEPARPLDERLLCDRDSDCGSTNRCVCQICIVPCDRDADCPAKDGWLRCEPLAKSLCHDDQVPPTINACSDRAVRDEDDAGSSHALSAQGHHPSGCIDAGCDARWVRESDFWSEVWIDGNAVEFYPTLSELAASADVAVVARLGSAEAGRVIQGDAPEDLYTEILVEAEVREVLRESTTERTLRFSLILPRVASLAARDASVQLANSVLPIDDVVLLLRQRTDEPYYRTVNLYGIWVRTTRSAVDAPLLPYAPRIKPGVYDAELEKLAALDALVEALR